MIEKFTHKALRFALSRRIAFRGSVPKKDGRITLLTVDYHVTDDAVQLIRSFRRFVDKEGLVVVVQNGSSRNNEKLRAVGARCVSTGSNLGHGLGLDVGMRFVKTQYTLICDPDTIILGPRFREEILSRLAKFDVAGVKNGSAFYHPICVAFATQLWKTQAFSFEQRWHKEPHFDVGGALTYEVLGKLEPEALLPRTRSAGPPLPSGQHGAVHYYGDVFGDVFANTYCMSRKIREPDRNDFDGWSRAELDAFHVAWKRWVAGIVEGREGVDEFPGRPLSEAPQSDGDMARNNR